MVEPICLKSSVEWNLAAAIEWPGRCRHAGGEADPAMGLGARHTLVHAWEIDDRRLGEPAT